MISSNTPWFPALLKSEEGEELARGEAMVLPEEQAVNFASDFVPLYPMGTPMEIVRLHKGREVHRFTGKVYLSDKELMRIVSVQDELLPGSEEAYCGNMNFSASLVACEQPAPKRRSLFSKAASQPVPFPITIIELTSELMTFYIEGEQTVALENKQRFYMHPPKEVPFPKKTIVEIQRSLQFGGKANYLCNFPMLTKGDRDLLHAFLIKYSLARNKIF